MKYCLREGSRSNLFKLGVGVAPRHGPLQHHDVVKLVHRSTGICAALQQLFGRDWLAQSTNGYFTVSATCCLFALICAFLQGRAAPAVVLVIPNTNTAAYALLVYALACPQNSIVLPNSRRAQASSPWRRVSPPCRICLAFYLVVQVGHHQSNNDAKTAQKCFWIPL